ncbi:MAG: HD domain-containing phosphohydrolase [Gemmatimonadota bacterium]
MSTSVATLISIGQCLSSMLLYPRGHPARERVVDNAYDKLLLLLEEQPAVKYSFVGNEVIEGKLVLTELIGWPWTTRLAGAGVERLEFTAPVARDEFEEFMANTLDRINGVSQDTSEARQTGRPSIRFGAIRVAGATTSELMRTVTTATMAFNLQAETETIQYLHKEVSEHDRIPLVEAEAVVRSLSMAMHRDAGVLLPLLQLKEYDQYTTTHSANVAVLAMGVAEELGLNPKDVRAFGMAGLLHDVGKVRVPIEVLNKVGPYTPEERKVMQLHPVDGARILLAREQDLDLAAVVAYEHHILLNGQGYPSFTYHRGCHAASNLVHVCDVYDALCTNRPYRDAWESEVALAYLEEGAGTDFDPDMVAAFGSLMRGANRQYVRIAEDEGLRTED